ncbi:Polycystin-1, partial [Stegodyphus mimosarum]
MGLVFFECSDFVTHLTFQCGIHAQQHLSEVRLIGPDIVPANRGTHLYQWNVNIKPTISGSLLKWFLQNDKEEITADTKLITSRRLIPGTYKLEVTVSNAFGHLNTSMSFEAAVTVVALNFTFTNLFVNQTSILSVTINQYAPPTQIFIDFGDGTTYDSSLNQSFFIHEPLGNFSSTFIVRHLYSSTGVYAVYLNASNSISSFEHWTVAVVEIPISGIYLQLLSPSVVALLEEVVVKCSVEHGSNLRFEWDFGEDNDGQYTTVESFETVSVANHSYGIPDMYHVAVCVFNDYESVVVHLNTSIQAVEPIEQLHLRPRSGLHAAPLFEVKKEFSINGSIQYSTEPITFEAWVFRGSDVQFLFDFGDGTSELVPSENVWSVPCASVKHSYSAEGNYEVSVIATNLLDSMNETLDPAFYVQFLPEGLTLDKQYYIVPYSSNVSVHASVVQGTNVSFSWIVDNTRINNTDSAIVLPILQPGVYIVYVEAFNYVTDFGFKIINRPKVSAKIYVQQILQGVILCLELDGKECCDLQKIELPLDVPVKFKAKISPSTERALRFIWNVGLPDMKRTNAPFLEHRYLHAGWYEVNMTAQNHISSASSSSFQLHMIQKIANLTSIYCQGPNLVNHTITCHALYWFG